MHDPITRLPPEISSEIFLHCLPGAPTPNALQAPQLLTNICSSWSHIALSTHELWKCINVDVEEHRYRDLPSILDVWLSRAGKRPLSVTLNGGFGDDTISVLKRHMWHVQELDTTFENDELKQLIAEESPSIRILRVQGYYPTSEVMPILSFVSQVEILAFEYLPDHDPPSDHPPEPVTLPSVQRVILGSHERFLDRVTLPSLNTLGLPATLPPLDTMARFLKRSSPPLQKLIVGNCEDVDMEDLWALVPSLPHLVLMTAPEGDPSPILTGLAESPHLLPNLTYVTLHAPSEPRIPKSWHSPLLAMLTARRGKISLHLEMDGDEAVAESELIGALQGFAADGMEIFLERRGKK
ncbi:hypothetical protein FB45DRAFT_900917 [Roridomyces roridus]|uniref:F-box domain-containing protein n=1 Tax=Roridomyces roridus TaxID=1738132 RepID=A0AAD7C854_9AGAR|nr:hypothetical protein FB45DRAFT_900917 [Roridomyces roridus]